MKAPQSVSFIQPLLSRGEEIRKVDPVVSYYCLFSAVGQLLETKLHTQDAEVAEFAESLLGEIETMKSELENNELLQDDQAGRAHVLNFAAAVFNKADRATHSGTVSKSTGAGFAAAAVFLGLESVWGELDTETSEKIRYAKFQATRILKAIRNGDDPNDLYKDQESESEAIHSTAGDSIGPNQESSEELAPKDSVSAVPDPDASTPVEPAVDNDSVPQVPHASKDVQESDDVDSGEHPADLPEPPRADPSNDLALPHAPLNNLEEDLSLPPPPAVKPRNSISPSPPPPPEKRRDEPAPVVKPAKTPLTPSPPKSGPGPASAPKETKAGAPPSTPEEIIRLTAATNSAQKHAKYAVSALNYDDINTAASHLEEALRVLRAYERATGKS